MEKGIDLDKIKADDIEVDKKQAKFDEAITHPLCIAAEMYLKQANQWLRKNEYFKKEKTAYLKQIDMGIGTEEQEKNIRIIDEAISIVNWHQFQIPVKLSSAIRYFPHDSDFEDEIQNMHHASAKIALIGVESSMKAWHTLLEITDEDREDFILKILLQLQILKRNIRGKFPLIHQFKRPGFDD